MPLSFAYGSNMDRDAMAARCPASRPLGPARLERHRLVIMREGYASVTHDHSRAVHGLLWDLALADILALDRYEGVAGGLYVKRHLAIFTQAGARRALVYIGTNAGPGAPRPGYLEMVLEAGRREGLPDAYLAEVSALAGAVGHRRALVPAVRPTRRTPLDPVRPVGGTGWRWSP